MTDLRALVRAALNNATENGYFDEIHTRSALETAVELCDQDAAIEAVRVTADPDGSGPPLEKFLNQGLVPLVEEWLEDTKKGPLS